MPLLCHFLCHLLKKLYMKKVCKLLANPYNLNGVSLEIRTPDPLIKSQMLYLLS